MAHQTGIEATEELNQFISRALKGSLRFLKVSIENEKLVPSEHAEPRDSWEDDLDVMLQPVLEEKKPCYIFYRLDDRNAHQNFLWVFMTYTPDFAAVRDKMMYAATKATIRKAFTSGVIIDDVSATTKDELTLKGYKHHVESQKAAPPLTEAEESLKRLHENEDHTDVGTSTRHSHLHGISFPIEQDAVDALLALKEDRVSYVRLSLDLKNERILLDHTETSLHADDLSSHIPDSSPRYHFFRFKHTHEGDYQEAIVFIYSCPGFKSTIKERMLYSSCKEPLVGVAEQNIGIDIKKKIEIDKGVDLNEGFIMDEVHPQKTAYRPQFMKPPPPSNRKRSRSPNRPPTNNN